MKKSQHIVPAVIGLVLLANCAPLFGAPPKGFIHAGVPHVYPGAVLTRPSSDTLLPATRPIIQGTGTTIYPGYSLIRPSDQALIPTGPR